MPVSNNFSPSPSLPPVSDQRADASYASKVQGLLRQEGATTDTGQKATLDIQAIGQLVAGLQDHRASDGFGQNSFGHDSFSHDSFSHDSFTHDSFSHDGFGGAGMGHDGFGGAGMGHDGMGHDGMGHDGMGGAGFGGQTVHGESFSGFDVQTPEFSFHAFHGESFDATSYSGSSGGVPPFANYIPSLDPGSPHNVDQSGSQQTDCAPTPTPTPAPTPAPAPAPLTVRNNSIDTGRYLITANNDDTASLKIFDKETQTFVTAHGDPHLTDSAGDTSEFQRASVNMQLADGTSVLLEPTAVNDKGVSYLSDAQVTKDGQTDTVQFGQGTVGIAENTGTGLASGQVINLGTTGDLNHLQVQTANGAQDAIPAGQDLKLDQFATTPQTDPVVAPVQPKIPDPIPTPTLTTSGNQITDGRYIFSANQFGANTLGIYDKQTHSTLTGFGDPHLEDGNGDSGNFQNASLRVLLANGTQVVMNPTALSATGVSSLANVQITTLDGKTDQMSNFDSQPVIAENVARSTTNPNVISLSTTSDLNSLQVLDPGGFIAALAPDLGDSKLDKYAEPDPQANPNTVVYG